MAGERFDFEPGELRSRTVRGAATTAIFLAAIDALVVGQGLAVTRLLGPHDIGIYGIVSVTVMTIVGLKRVGIDEAYVAQQSDEQELEFQRAFTLELALSVVFAAAILVLAPILAAAYGEHRLLGLTLASAYLPVAFALQAPLWIFFRRMDYARQRSLQAIQPLVTVLVTVPMAATGCGVWSLVAGTAAGYAAAVPAGIRMSPYRLALRFDGMTARRYLHFSTGVFVAVIGAMVIAQGQVVAFRIHGGLAAAGYVTLAVTITRYVDRADQIVTATIYPAIAAIRGRTDALRELFVKSNRATLLWVLPFTAAAILFAPDLVHFVLGDRWAPATELIQGLAGAGVIQHLGFNWFAFYRAHEETRSQAVEAVAGAVAFLVLACGGLALWGVDGFVAGRIVAVALAVAVRWVYVRRMLPGVTPLALLAPAVVPLAAACAAAAALRLALWGGHRSAWQALAELTLFVAVYGAGAWRREKPLVAELAAAMR